MCSVIYKYITYTPKCTRPKCILALLAIGRLWLIDDDDNDDDDDDGEDVYDDDDDMLFVAEAWTDPGRK